MAQGSTGHSGPIVIFHQFHAICRNNLLGIGIQNNDYCDGNDNKEHDKQRRPGPEFGIMV